MLFIERCDLCFKMSRQLTRGSREKLIDSQELRPFCYMIPYKRKRTKSYLDLTLIPRFKHLKIKSRCDMIYILKVL